MPNVLYDDDVHRCVVFSDLVRGEDGVQANQFLIQHGAQSALIDPGGALLYTPLSLAMTRYVQPTDLTYIIASHQDPDIIGAVDRWLMYTSATVVCSKLWGRFVPHSVPHYQKNTGRDRYLLLEDAGGVIPFGERGLVAVPAHFLHSVGNFGFYDPVSRILFSGDVGSSLVPTGEAYAPVRDFAAHVHRMEGFHRRYMASHRACALWADMVRRIDPVLVVPQHGLPLEGPAIPAFLDWLGALRCGVDLLGPADYAVPTRLLQLAS
ncbi:MBL fold metallo-hydrolase [Coralloluteibacterium thermophilus]|uniref:MBL fold metallo-hydrolase n=1 Tax=Coralloluteibacterium thermophilum TaxID=2707049 RepID=A0ABV9NM16_9GAMM